MIFITILLLLVIQEKVQTNPNRGFYSLSTAEIIRKSGYPAEEHVVKTEDGYEIRIFRIPYGIKKSSVAPKPILLQNGFLCSSDCWIINGPSQGLGYILADSGYDVWLGNNRGNIYSRINKNFSIKQKAFWNFSFHEMGYYDLPAMIDYILNKTGYKKTAYIGHSQGTTVFFVMASTRVDYNDKVNVMVGLAPVAYLGNIRGAMRRFSQFSASFIVNWSIRPSDKALLGSSFVKSWVFFGVDTYLDTKHILTTYEYFDILSTYFIDEKNDNGSKRDVLIKGDYFNYLNGIKSLSEILSLNYVLDRSSLLSLIGHILCTVDWKFCYNIISYITGPDLSNYDKALSPFLADICPTGASIKQIVHFNQLIHSGNFTLYDYKEKNTIFYNSTSPPEYNLSAISSPVILYLGGNDYISTIPEVNRLFNEIKTIEGINKLSTFNHLDFLWSKNAKDIIYDGIIQVINKYTSP